MCILSYTNLACRAGRKQTLPRHFPAYIRIYLMPIVFNTYVCVLFGHDVYICVSCVWAASRPSRRDQLTQQRVGEEDTLLDGAPTSCSLCIWCLFWHISGSLLTYENIVQPLYNPNIVETRKKDAQSGHTIHTMHTYISDFTHVCRLKRSVFFAWVSTKAARCRGGGAKPRRTPRERRAF